MDVTVVTPSLPSRSDLLGEAMASVAAQTLSAPHLIAVDHRGEGPAPLRNRLLAATGTKWVAFLDDDDLLDPCHLEELVLAGERAAADVVIPWCRFEGGSIPVGYYNVPYDRATLRRHGIFPITVLAKTTAILAGGGFRPEDRYEDWSLWNRMADQGRFFLTVNRVTWTYRMGRADHRTLLGA